MAMSDTKLRTIPKETLKLMYHLIKPLLNASTDEHAMRIKQAFLNNYAAFAFFYGMLGCFGVCLNAYFLFITIKEKMYRSTLHCFLMHIACVNILNCLFILPISLIVLLLRYWVFGNFMCFAVIVLQDLPSRLILLTFVLIAIHRYRQFAYNSLHTFPKHFYLIAVWVLSLCLSLPACVFVDFHDMGQLFKNSAALKDVGICVVNNHKMEEYARAMFIILYVIPWSVIAFAFTRISIELSKHEQPLYYTRSSVDVHDELQASRDSLDIESQIRIQKYLTLTVGSLFICTLPLNSMFLIQFAVEEDDSLKSARFDILYAILVWMSFFSVITTPIFGLMMRKAKFVVLLTRVWKDSMNFEYYRERLSTFALSIPNSRSQSTIFAPLPFPKRLSVGLEIDNATVIALTEPTA